MLKQVYFARELQLLFMHAGFEIESVYGDYTRRPCVRPFSS
jgi:hypothetical protein